MKKLYSVIAFLFSLNAFSQNLQLAAYLNYNGVPLANINGFVDTLGNEYALVGTYYGLDIVDVTVPSNPVIKFSVYGPQSEWREVKTYRKYAYVTTEGGGGLTVVDLSQLPDTFYFKQYTGDGLIANQLGSIHALHCDTATGYLYLYGSDIGSGNTIFLDLTDPWNPAYAGQYEFPSGGNTAYVHDGIVSNDTMYEAHIYSGFFAVVDVRNKSNPVLLATQNTPTNFTHNTWLSDNHKTLFTTDENNGSFLGAYDISDLSNIRELSRFQTAPGSGAIIHNTHILNDYAITSWYKEGVVITDVSHPDNPIEVGHYDTYTQGAGGGFNGCWGVYPFLPSGTIVASDIDNGLYVLSPTYIRGCYLEGTVTDSVTNNLLSGVLVEVLTTTISRTSDISGEFKTGTAVAGSYDIRFSKAGYYSRTVNVSLNNGVLTALNVLLVPIPTFAFSGTVTDSLTGLPVAGASVFLEGPGLNYNATSDVNGEFTIPSVVPETYTMNAGKWGYRTSCVSMTLTQGMPLNAVIAEGYYDDFTFDFGWTVNGSSSNAWERGEPVGTFDDNLVEINPDFDVTTDCSSSCYVTDNGGGTFSSHDVDNGNTILTSPVFDATIYADPHISYSRRFLDNSYNLNQPNDTMKIRLSNGFTDVVLETIEVNSPSNGSWLFSSFLISSLITPTSTMQLSVEIEDYPAGNVLEGAFDQFEVTGQLLTATGRIEKNESALTVFPNPFKDELTLNSRELTASRELKVCIKDILGRVVFSNVISGFSGSMRLGKELQPGIYLLTADDGLQKRTVKIVKE